MFLTYGYDLKPTRSQRSRLESVLECQRSLYNAALQERRDAWRLCRQKITRIDQFRSLTEIRNDDPVFGALPAVLSRWTLGKVDLAFAAFFARKKAKRSKAGYPRFRSTRRWRSFGFSEWSGIRLIDNRLAIKGIGAIRIHLHRPLPDRATPKSCTITKDGKKWRISIQIAIPDFVGPHTYANREIGLDLNVLNRATDSQGRKIANLRPLAVARSDIRVAQRIISRRTKRSHRRQKAVERLKRLHRKVLNRRKTAMHQASARIARTNGVIAIERLTVSNMMRSARGTGGAPGSNVRQKAGLNRSLADVAPATFKDMLAYKAERAGGRIIEVAPQRTSIDCSACGTPVPKTLKQRVHRCPHCGLTMDRDQNAARNILFRAQAVEGLRDANVDKIGSPDLGSSVISEISLEVAATIPS